uniref:RAB24, member RAS onco family n=1 Tax=Anser brachyrhynchus TaxID=132585 RepID=A0A8B9I8Y7_9AVES
MQDRWEQLCRGCRAAPRQQGSVPGTTLCRRGRGGRRTASPGAWWPCPCSRWGSRGRRQAPARGAGDLPGALFGCRIYLCGTKSDLLEDDPRTRAVDFHDAQDYADEVKAELFETSSKTGRSVDELFQKVAEDYVHFSAFQVMTEEKGVDLAQKSSTYFYSCCHH